MSKQEYQALTAEQWGEIYNEKIYSQVIADINKNFFKRKRSTISTIK